MNKYTLIINLGHRALHNLAAEFLPYCNVENDPPDNGSPNVLIPSAHRVTPYIRHEFYFSADSEEHAIECASNFLAVISQKDRPLGERDCVLRSATLSGEAEVVSGGKYLKQFWTSPDGLSFYEIGGDTVNTVVQE